MNDIIFNNRLIIFYVVMILLVVGSNLKTTKHKCIDGADDGIGEFLGSMVLTILWPLHFLYLIFKRHDK